MIGLFYEDLPDAPASTTSPFGSAAASRRAPPGQSQSARSAVSPRPMCYGAGTQNRRGIAPNARAHLDDALGLLANCADIYARCDNASRRLCNQAFFTKIYIDEDAQLHVERTTAPSKCSSTPRSTPTPSLGPTTATKPEPKPSTMDGKGSSLVFVVELRGFEPLTFSLRTRRATSCAIAPSTGRW